MALFKISFHCGQVNTYVVEEFTAKEDAFDHWEATINNSKDTDSMLKVGDVLINSKQITFVVIEQVVEQGAEPAAGTTVDV